MPTYSVQVLQITRYDIIIDADDPDDAKNKVQKMSDLPHGALTGDRRYVEDVAEYPMEAPSDA